MEYAFLLFLTLIGCIPFLPLARASRRLKTLGFILVCCCLPVMFAWAAIGERPPESDDAPVKNRPIVKRENGYVGSAACRACHPGEHESWHHSWHRTMTQVASPETLIGPPETMHWFGKTWKLFERDGQLLVNSEIPESVRSPQADPFARIERPAVLTTGSHHMQVCWYPIFEDKQSLAMLPFAWVKEAKRWIPRDAVFLTPPKSNMTSEVGRWSNECIACHATAGTLGLANDPELDADGGFTVKFSDANPQVMDFGISCEACHGPGAEHVRANESPLRRYRQHFSDAADDTIVRPSRLSHIQSSQICGQCHSISVTPTTEANVAYAKHGHDFRPGDDLDKSSRRKILRCGAREGDRPDLWEESFWSDGQVRVSGREYNGLIESPCFQRGKMSCISCHKMHPDSSTRDLEEWSDDQLGHGMRTNSACVQCHQEFASEATLTAHTHHSANSSGSNCYNCHMAYSTYGLLKALRSHTIESPSVATTLTTGRPNACNQCHLDQTLQWSATHLQDWFEQPIPEMSDDQKTVANSILMTLKGDAGQRALMAWSFGWGPAQNASGTDWMAPWLSELMRDNYHAIRYIAERSLKTLPQYSDVDYDFIGGPQYWAAARAEIDAEFREHFPARYDRETLRRLLLSSEKKSIRSDDVNRLLKTRDNRPVNLGE